MTSNLSKHYLTSIATLVTCSSLLLGVACESYVPPDATGGTVAVTGGAASGGASGTTGGSVSGNGGTSPAALTIPAKSENNLLFHSATVLPPITAQAANADLVIDWSGVTMDMFGRPLDQATLTAAVVVIWDGITLVELADAINRDDQAFLSSKAPLGAHMLTAGGTVKSAKFGDFLLPGKTPVRDQADFADVIALGSSYVFTVMLQNGPLSNDSVPSYGFDVAMIQGFELTADGMTTVALSNASTTLTWTADLDTPAPTMVPAGKSDIVIDWSSSITTTSYNTVFTYNYITEVLIGRYDPSIDLNKQFVDIKTIGKDLWQIKSEIVQGSPNPDFSSTAMDFSKLKNAQGQAFPGLEAGTEDQYLLALVCGEPAGCRNPTPWYVTRLKASP